MRVIIQLDEVLERVRQLGLRRQASAATAVARTTSRFKPVTAQTQAFRYLVHAPNVHGKLFVVPELVIKEDVKPGNALQNLNIHTASKYAV